MRIFKLAILLLGLASVSSVGVQDIRWGVATAAYQIEGAWNVSGKGESIWDFFSHIPGTTCDNETGDVADDFYHKYEEDVQMMAVLGIKHFRMSLSWARLLPNGTTDYVNQAGIDFYNRVFDIMDRYNITPYVTLYHWDLPQAFNNFTDQSTWLNPEITDRFAEYANFSFATFGHRIKYWITFNEPHSFAQNGYMWGVHAPGRCSPDINERCVTIGGGGNTSTEFYIVSHHVILAHAKAYHIYNDTYRASQGGVIGMNTDSQYYEPWDPESEDDIEAINTSLLFNFGIYNDPIVFGDYPQIMREYITGGRLPTFSEDEKKMIKGTYDYLGVNHYTTNYVHYTGEVGTDYSNDNRAWYSSTNINGTQIGPQAQSSWLFVYPPGFGKFLTWVHHRYNRPDIFVFENGVSVPGENDDPISVAVHDQFRINYLNDYIQSMFDAIEEHSINILGYFAWSILDNYEWSDGFSVRFGMVYVDYEDNQRRYIKDSAMWYSNFTQSLTSTAYAFGAEEFVQ